jgi:hypothetical protein
MTVFHAECDRPKVPSARFAAEDGFDLGEQLALHLVRHRVLSRAVPFQAEVGDDFASITQSGLPRPVTFVIRKES